MTTSAQMLSHSNSALNSILHQYQSDAKRRSTSKIKKIKAPKTSSSGFSAPVNPHTSTGSSSSGHGLLSMLGNLGGDIKDTVVGMPAGVLHLAEHPVASAEAIGKDYKTRYGPLLGYLNGGGDIGKFAHNIQQHPLSYLLDAATVATAGGGAIAKLGQSSRVAEIAADASNTGRVAGVARKLQKASEGGTTNIAPFRGAAKSDKTIPITLQKNPVKRLRTKVGVKISESLPQIGQHQVPIIGLKSRANRVAKLDLIKKGAEGRSLQRSYNKLLDKKQSTGLKVGEDHVLHTVANGISRGVSPTEHLKLIKDNYMAADNPLKKEFLRRHGTEADYAAAVNKRMAKLTKQIAAPEVKSLRAAALLRYKHDSIIADGVRLEREDVAGAAAKAEASAKKLMSENTTYRDLAMTDRAKNVTDLVTAHGNLASDAAEKLVQSGTLQRDEVATRSVFHRTMADALTGRKRTPEQIKTDYKRMHVPEPHFTPDFITRGYLNSRNIAKKNEGKLFKAGRQVDDPQNIVLNHEIASKMTDYRDAQQVMMQLGKPIDKPENLPKGWVYVQNRQKTLEELAKMNKDQLEGGPIGREEFWKNLTHEKHTPGAIAIPKELRDELIQIHGHMGVVRRNAVTEAVKGWKYFTLAARPAFAVNNVVSNQILHWVKNGLGVTSWKAAKKYDATYDKYFHEMRDTFGSTEAIKGGKPAAAFNVLYKIVGKHEDMLKRQTFYMTAKKLPEVKKQMRLLQKEGHTGDLFPQAFERAVTASRAAEKAGRGIDITKLIAKNIDDTLGNYRYYTAQERMLKGIVPFYGWNRHSTRAFVRLLEDNPAQAALATQIGLQGHEKSLKDMGVGLPEFMQTYVKSQYIKSLGDQLGLNTDTMDFSQWNPYLTAVQGAQAATGNKNAIVGLLGPTVTGPMEYITGKSLLTGAPVPKTKLPGPLGMLENTVKGLPPVKLADYLTSKDNENKKMLPSSDREQELRYLAGLPFRTPNLDIARATEKNRLAQVKRTNSKSHKVTKYSAPKGG